MSLLALFTAFLLGGVVIWITSGSLDTVVEAYAGLFRGAFIKERGLSETLVASVPYILLSLAVAVGFKSGLFNIGVEGQFYIGAISAAWVGQAVQGLPAIISLPLAIGAGALGGAIWAAIPGYLKARFGVHEVINTIMMNYIAFRLAEYVVSGPLRDKLASAPQTPRVSPAAELWTFSAIPKRLQDPMNAFAVALIAAFITWLIMRWVVGRPSMRNRISGTGQRRALLLGVSAFVGVIVFVGLPSLSLRRGGRLPISMIDSIAVCFWLCSRRWPCGGCLPRRHWAFRLRMVGANPNAARYAGVNITRNIVTAMAMSGALAGIAGTIEILGVSICRCLPLFFSSGYGFDSIAIALLAKNNPFGIIAGSFLFGAMRNGADLMELTSGVSKYIISLIQALVLLFVAAPGVVRWMYRIKSERRPEEEAPLTRGWGG